MERLRPALLIFFLAMASLLFSQATGPSPATISFTLDFPQSTPAHYSIVVDSSGKTNYTSGLAQPQSNAGSDSDDTTSDSGQPYHYTFTISPATRDHIFDLAARANYFSRDVNYTKHNIANTGEKILTYKDSQRSTQARYNYTANPAVQQLTTLFQSLSATLEYGRRLDEAYRYQKLALDEELKSMEQQADQNGLVEVQAVAPILKKIAADPAVINVTRARAERLLAKSTTTAATH
jgi:hypothetical protein